MSTPLLTVTGLTKTFPGLRALDDVSIEVGAGEVVAVVGQNGSGKSTLVKILAGVYDADPGATVKVMGADGHTVEGREAHDELHFIHQDLGLIPMLTTIENLDLGTDYGAGGSLRLTHPEQEAQRAEELIARFGASFDVRVPIAQLSAAERTIVAIARALDGWTRTDHVLILDEPTAALHGDEVGRLFEAVRRVAEQGAGIIFISHRLDEVLDLADRVVALRDGKLVADLPVAKLNHDALIEMITGHEISEARIEREVTPGDVALSVNELSGATVAEFDLELRAGEIVGVTGILGSGREHIASLIFGAIPRAAGDVKVAGRALHSGDPGSAVADDVAFVPADRAAMGAVMDMNVRENITLPRLSPLRRAMYRIDARRERKETDAWIEDVGLRPAEPEQYLRLFSGGNQQKVVLAKWLRNRPKVMLLDEPTQGVDVGAKVAIYELMARAASEGAAVLVCSGDTQELTRICDRVIVMRDGRIATEVQQDGLDEQRLVRESLGLGGDEAGELFGDLAEDTNA